LFIAGGSCAGAFEQTIGKSRFAVINVRYDAKIARAFYGHQERSGNILKRNRSVNVQKEQYSQFRFTPQVAIILAVTMIALIIPILCIAIGARDYFKKPAPQVDSAAFTPLQKALENVADKQLEPKSLSDDSENLTLTVANPQEAEAKIEARAVRLGGFAMQTGSGKADEIHILIHLPANRRQAFIDSPLESGAKDPKTMTGDDQARTLIDVVIRKRAE
jgi:hypothetical protein